jgi:hypothetical protein
MGSAKSIFHCMVLCFSFSGELGATRAGTLGNQGGCDDEEDAQEMTSLRSRCIRSSSRPGRKQRQQQQQQQQ